MRLIFLGHCSFYTVSNFAKAIKENIENVTITVADPVKPGGDILTDEDKNSFDEIIQLPSKKNIRLSFSDKLKSFKKIFRKRSEIKFLIKNLFLLRLNTVKNNINSNAENFIYEKQMTEILKEYDVYHFHYLAPEFLTPLKWINNDKKILLTFWGSDLFQVAGVQNYEKQLEALKRAELITINSVEMKETFLAKFGRGFESKVRLADFGLNEKKLQHIRNKDKEKTTAEFKKKYNIEKDQIIIIIGYSGSSKQRHIEILKILNSLSEDVRIKIFAILPMTYGLQFEDNKYLDEVKDECSRSAFGTKIITDFMPDDEFTELIIAGQVKLNLRDTDAMNAAMLESLFAGCIVVNGSWLPYGKLRRLGIYYNEIDKLEDLKELIPQIVNNFENEKNKTKNNEKLTSDNFSYSNTIADWLNVYKEINFKQIN